MRTSARLITTFIVLAILAGCGVAVLYFGTSTGLGFGAGTTLTGAAVKKAPFYAQTGWIRNNSPWPVQITDIEVNETHTAKKTVISLTRQQDAADDGTSTDKASTDAPSWAASPVKLPYTLVGGSLRYFGFALSPAQDEVGSFTTITVTFSGPLGFTFHKTYDGSAVAASSATLPTSILATDPGSDASSLDAYIQLLRSGLIQRDNSDLATVMGNDATSAQAAKLKKSQVGYKTSNLVQATDVKADDPYKQTLVFYASNPAKGHKPITVEWTGFRWAVTSF
jgi:hypothetical protein